MNKEEEEDGSLRPLCSCIEIILHHVCCCFSISLLGTKERGTSKEEIQLQNKSKNEEKNATDANSL